MSQRKKISQASETLNPMDLELKEFLKPALRAVFGELIKGDELNPAKIGHEIVSFFEGMKPVIVTIGDMCTQTMIDLEMVPNLSIVDGLTQRKKTKKVEVKGAEIIELVNPAGEIKKKVWGEIRKYFEREERRKVQIIIDGEEDLLALPVIVEAPMKSYVLYGVPPIETQESGIMIVRIDEEIKEKIRKIMVQMM